MRAVICERLAGIDGLTIGDIPSPVLKDGQVRIANRAAGLNFPDLLMLEGKYQTRPEPPFVPGMECAGVVAETRSPRFRVGDRVMAGMKTGAFAEETAVDAAALMSFPDALSFEEAATFRVGFKTAYHALVPVAKLQPGEWVLITGASGGVGLAAVALAKRLGAHVIATVGTPAKADAVRTAGADVVVDLTRQDVRDMAMAATANKGVDVVYEAVGGDLFLQTLRACRYGARVLIIGFASGTIPSVPINRYLIKGLVVHGIRAGETRRRSRSDGDEDEDTRAVLALAADGSLKPHISVRLPLAEARRAFELMRDRGIAGRAALIIRD
jgi:NADPH2:quinone reductase